MLFCVAVLDDENKELRQKLSALMQESRTKDSINQNLSKEVSELKHKRDSGQLGNCLCSSQSNSPAMRISCLCEEIL